MERDFVRQMVLAKGDARAAQRRMRAFRAGEAADMPAASDASYVAARRRDLRVAVAEAAAFDQVIDPVARDLAGRRR